jgi:hypothetical protein
MRQASKTPPGRLVGATCPDQIEPRRNLRATVAGAVRAKRTLCVSVYIYMHICMYSDVYTYAPNNTTCSCECCASYARVHFTASTREQQPAQAKAAV